MGCSPIKKLRELGSNRRNGGVKQKCLTVKPTHIGELLLKSQPGLEENSEGNYLLKFLDFQQIKKEGDCSPSACPQFLPVTAFCSVLSRKTKQK